MCKGLSLLSAVVVLGLIAAPAVAQCNCGYGQVTYYAPAAPSLLRRITLRRLMSPTTRRPRLMRRIMPRRRPMRLITRRPRPTRRITRRPRLAARAMRAAHGCVQYVWRVQHVQYVGTMRRRVRHARPTTPRLTLARTTLRPRRMRPITRRPRRTRRIMPHPATWAIRP